MADSFTLQKFHTLVRLNPNDPEAHFGLAMALEEKNDIAEAAKEYDYVLRLSSQRHARSFLHKGFLYARVDDRALAIREWQKAWELDPSIGNVMKDPAHATFYNRKIQSSLEQFNRPITLNPNDGYAHFHLGMAYKFFDKPELALQSLKRAMDINPRLWEAYAAAGQIYAALGQNTYAILHFSKAADANPKYAEAHFHLGVIYDRENMIAKAVHHLERALELDTDNARIYHALGNTYMKAQQVMKAIKMYQKSVDLDPRMAEVHFAMARACEAIFKPDYAIQEYERAIELEPRYAEALYQLGMICLQVGNVPKAIESLEQCLKISPADPYAHYNLAEAYRRHDNYQKAIPHYFSAIELNPKDAFAHYNLALAYAKTGQHEQAVPQYQKAIQLAPREGHFHFEMARSLQKLTRFEEAIREFECALDVNPNDTDALSELACCYMESGQFDACIKLYQRVIQLNPESADAHYHLGQAFLRLDEYDYAYEEFQRATKLDNRHVASLYELGCIYLNQRNRPEMAADFLKRALSFRPDFVEARMDLGDAYMKMGRLEDARAEIESVRNSNGDDAEVRMRSAQLLLEMQRPDEAMTELTMAITLDPERAEARVALGRIYEDRGQIANAADQYRSAVLLRPRDMEYLLKAARLSVQVNHIEEAKSLYDRMLKIDPDHEEASQELEALFDRAVSVPQPPAAPPTPVAPSPPQPPVSSLAAPQPPPAAPIVEATGAYDPTTGLPWEAEMAAAVEPPSPPAAVEPPAAPAVSRAQLEAMFRKAMLCHAMGKKDEAASLFQQILEIAPDFYQAYFYVGKSALAKGETFAARFLFEQGLQLSREKADSEFQRMFGDELTALGAEVAPMVEPAVDYIVPDEQPEEEEAYEEEEACSPAAVPPTEDFLPASEEGEPDYEEAGTWPSPAVPVEDGHRPQPVAYEDTFAQPTFEDTNYGGYSQEEERDHTTAEGGYADNAGETRFGWYSSSSAEETTTGVDGYDSRGIDFNPPEEVEETVAEPDTQPVHEEQQPVLEEQQPVLEEPPAEDMSPEVMALPPEVRGSVHEDLLLAADLVEAKRYEQARIHLEQVLEQAPHLKEGAMRLAHLHRTMERLPEGIAVLEKALGYHAGDIEVHDLLADLYMAQDQRQRAMEVYMRALDRQPENAMFKERLARFGPAVGAAGGADHRETIPWLQRATKEDPSNLELMVKLARAYGAADKQALAVVQYQKALKIDDRPEVYLELAQTYERLGKSEAAFRTCLTAEEKHPDFADVARLLLGQLTSRGEWEHAARVVERLLAGNAVSADERGHLEAQLEEIYENIGAPLEAAEEQFVTELPPTVEIEQPAYPRAEEDLPVAEIEVQSCAPAEAALEAEKAIPVAPEVSSEFVEERAADLEVVEQPQAEVEVSVEAVDERAADEEAVEQPQAAMVVSAEAVEEQAEAVEEQAADVEEQAADVEVAGPSHDAVEAEREAAAEQAAIPLAAEEWMEESTSLPDVIEVHESSAEIDENEFILPEDRAQVEAGDEVPARSGFTGLPQTMPIVAGEGLDGILQTTPTVAEEAVPDEVGERAEEFVEELPAVVAELPAVEAPVVEPSEMAAAEPTVEQAAEAGVGKRVVPGSTGARKGKKARDGKAERPSEPARTSRAARGKKAQAAQEAAEHEAVEQAAREAAEQAAREAAEQAAREAAEQAAREAAEQAAREAAEREAAEQAAREAAEREAAEQAAREAKPAKKGTRGKAKADLKTAAGAAVPAPEAAAEKPVDVAAEVEAPSRPAKKNGKAADTKPAARGGSRKKK